MKKQSDYYIDSIKKSIHLLKEFSQNKVELGITELSKNLKLPKSTILRILVTLASEGFVVKNPENQKYSLGIELFKLGSIVQRNFDIRKYALPIMKDLANKTGESVYLNVISGWRRVCIEKIESSNDIRRIIKLGESLPLYTGGSGKAILAYLPEEEIKVFLKEEKLIPFTPNTITDPAKLLQDLEEIRKQGYAIAVGERVPGATTIGAPIFNNLNKVFASLTVSGPTERLIKNKIPKFASLLKEAAKKISILLGSGSNINSIL